jgi:hypothetical protein
MIARVARWLEFTADLIERSTPAALVLVSFFYLSVYAWLAAHRALWYDELFSYHTQRLPTVAAMIAALNDGVDQMPMWFALMSRPFAWLPLAPEIAMRIPALLGVLVMGLALFGVVAKHLGTLYGFIAMLFPLCTGVAPYALEARSYGLVLGFGGLALWFWQRAADRRGPWPAVAMSLCLSGTLGAHYYAGLLLGPLALAELVRQQQARRRDWPILFAMGASVWVMLPLVAQMRVISAGIVSFWGRPQITTLFSFFRFFVEPGILPLSVLAALIAGYVAWHRGTVKSPLAIPLPERVFALASLASPSCLVLATLATSTPYSDRYAITATLGISMLAAYFVASVAPSRALAASVILIQLALCWVPGSRFLNSPASRADELVTALRGARQYRELPVAFASPSSLVEHMFYAPPDFRGRFAQLASREIARRRIGTDSLESMGELGAKWFGWPVQPLEEFVRHHDEFLVFDSPAQRKWLIPELIERGYQLDLLWSGEALLYRAHR